MHEAGLHRGGQSVLPFRSARRPNSSSPLWALSRSKQRCHRRAASSALASDRLCLWRGGKAVRIVPSISCQATMNARRYDAGGEQPTSSFEGLCDSDVISAASLLGGVPCAYFRVRLDGGGRSSGVEEQKHFTGQPRCVKHGVTCCIAVAPAAILPARCALRPAGSETRKGGISENLPRLCEAQGQGDEVAVIVPASVSSARPQSRA